VIGLFVFDGFEMAEVFCEGFLIVAVIAHEDLLEKHIIGFIELIAQETTDPLDRKFVAFGVFLTEGRDFAIHERPPTQRFFGVDEIAYENRLVVEVENGFPAFAGSIENSFAGDVSVAVSLSFHHDRIPSYSLVFEAR
jgi:hypothetical protein